MLSRKERIRIRHARVRSRVAGTKLQPRLAVHFSGRHVYLQIVDDENGCTLASANTTEQALRIESRSNTATAIRMGTIIAERAKGLNINRVVFDRGGGRFHGKVRALAEAVRKSGIKF